MKIHPLSWFGPSASESLQDNDPPVLLWWHGSWWRWADPQEDLQGGCDWTPPFGPSEISSEWLGKSYHPFFFIFKYWKYLEHIFQRLKIYSWSLARWGKDLTCILPCSLAGFQEEIIFLKYGLTIKIRKYLPSGKVFWDLWFNYVCFTNHLCKTGQKLNMVCSWGKKRMAVAGF